jgi:regulator of sigma E protease
MFDFSLDWVLPTVVILTALIFFHELGHYLVARWCGVAVETFSIGFGREIVGWTAKSGTRWRIAMLPLGGYVKFAGDQNAASAPDHASIDPNNPNIFHNKPLWQRAAVVFAGPAANFLLAIVIFAGLFVSIGQPHTPAMVDRVIDGSPAAAAGLLPGDVIIEANGETVDGFNDLQRIVAINLDREMTLMVRRDGGVVSVGLRPDVIEQDDGFGRTSRIGRVGVIAASKREYRQMGPIAAVGEAVESVWETITATLQAVGDMITGDRSVSELRGPPGIAHLAGEVAKLGIVPLVNFAAFISISLGLINLFPIPMLDGGHLLFYAVEAVRGKPLGDAAQEIGYRIGLGLVVTLMVVATFNDLDQFGLVDMIGGLFS